jgi:heavy metal translocating P-type ATPase
MVDARNRLGTGAPHPSSAAIAAAATVAIALHVVLRSAAPHSAAADLPLYAVLLFGGIPLTYGLVRKLAHRQFGSDLLAGISIITAAILGEYLAGSIVVLMLAGGDALEQYALRTASSVLEALAKRMPSVGHLKHGADIVDVPLDDIAVGNILLVHPHEVCPVDGEVIEGHGRMDEAYLTGEPFEITKTRGSRVMSGAINGDAALVVRATARAVDSRYATITEVMRESAQTRPRLRRLGDQLGAIYTPIALAVAGAAWVVTGTPTRFLAVLVIATPCPLLIAIPVAIIGSISLCARRSIIVKSSLALEQISGCRTAIFDKTGTLTYGAPSLTVVSMAPGFTRDEVMTLVASIERYSRHPLARAVLAAQPDLHRLPEATEVSEPPGEGLCGVVEGRRVVITSRARAIEHGIHGIAQLGGSTDGLECTVVIDGRAAAILQFRDAPRDDSRRFVEHLRPAHHFTRVMIVSGDRPSEVRYLAAHVGVTDVHAQQSPEEKLAIVRAETALARTLYVGDGINDAPAMMAATVGVAIGQHSDVTTEAASVVIMDNSLRKVDEFIHISRRMRTIALQSAVGGMALSVAGMLLASGGWLTPVEGAVGQELIDIAAVVNALRAALPPGQLYDM